MKIARSLQRYLSAQGVAFELLAHPYAEGSYNTARAAGIPIKNLAKAVLFRDEDFNYVLAIVPANHRVLRYTMNQIFNCHMELAGEEECWDVFPDCLEGAVPPVGQPYHIQVVWEDALQQSECLYLEAGDHQHLLKVKTAEFIDLMDNAPHEHISSDKRYHPPPKTKSLPYSGLGLL